MPKLEGKKYSYDDEGKAEYKKALKKKRKTTVGVTMTSKLSKARPLKRKELKPLKTKKRKLKKMRKKIVISGGEYLGLVAGSTIAQRSAMKGKSKKDKEKLFAKMVVGNLITQGVVAGGKKIYNKVVDKVNKKRGYKK